MKTISRLVFLFTIFVSVYTQAQDTSLVAYFPFNGNALDVTGNGHNGTVNGGVLTNDRFNQQEKAYTFPNLHNNIVLDNSVGLNLESGFTLNAWIKYKNVDCGFVGKHNCWVINGFYFGISSNQIYLRVGNSTWSEVITNETFLEDKWYMVTGVFDSSSSTIKIYVDGILKVSGSGIYNNFSPASMTISEASNGCPNGNMPGAIDEVKIYNRALSDAEILAEYNSTYSDLVLFLPFNGNANDESGNNNNGTVSGSSLTQDRFGVNGKAYDLDGVDDFISIADNPNLFSDELTVSWWYKMSDLVGGRVVIGWVDGGHRYQQFFSNDQLSYFNGYNVNQGGTYFNPIYTSTDINVWKNVVVTYKKLTETTSTTSIYVDGELKQADNHTLAMDYASGPDFFIGKNHNGNFFKGSLDDFRIYNRILNDTEILELYQDSTTYQPQLISSVYPLQNSNNCLRNESIQVSFTEPMNEATFNYNSVSTFGNLTGSYELSFNYQSSTNTIDITPTVPFKYGEQITVTLDSTIQSVSGYNLLPFTFQFNIKPEKGSVKFAVADSFQLNFQPTNIVSGDFNNDNKIDVIVSNYDSSKYTVLINNGSGGFNLGEEMTGEFKPYSISFTDIDSDRDLDMIVCTYEQNKIRILRGSGQGIFSWILPYTDVNVPIATCPGDFDGDGDNDFVALCNTGLAIFYRNDGTGLFSPIDSTLINVAATIRNVTGDIDNDGDLDIIVGHNEYFAQFRILRNDGNGVFTSEPGMDLGPHPDEFAGGDFDGDYDLDFVHCAWYGNGISLILNDGQGNYNDYLNLGNVGGQTRNPIVNDFDGDGDQDFVGVFNSNNVGIVKNNTHPNYELALSYPIAGLKGIAPGDFDNNGSVDLVGISTSSNQAKFIKNCLDSLVAYYPFIGDANDASGNINNGVIYNAALEMDRFGTPNSALFFAGDGYVEGLNPGNNLPTGNSPRSFTAWVNTGVNNPNGSNIFHFGTSESAPTNFHFLITNPAGLGNGYGYGVVYGNTNVADGSWHFVSAVYEGGTERNTKIYVDGKPDGSGQISTEPNTILNSKWSIGKFMSGYSNFNGYVDEIKVYNEILSDEEIWNLYKVTTTAPTLLFPKDDSTLINNLTPLMDWDSTVTAINYRLLISTDSSFNDIRLDTIISSSFYQVEDLLLYVGDHFYWKVRTINDGGIGPWSDKFHFNIMFTDVKDEIQLPTEFALLQNYPNPFNPATTITYHLPKTAYVELKVYDVIGNEIATLVNEEKPVGSYEVEFNSSRHSRENGNLTSGIYFYHLKAGDFVSTKKMILIK